MPDKEIMTVCSEIHTKHINTLCVCVCVCVCVCAEFRFFLMVNDIVHKVTSRFLKITIEEYSYWKCLDTLKAFAVDCGHIFNI